MRKIIFAFTLICCSLLPSALCKAQNTAGIQGKVADASGAAIPYAVVTLTDLATNTVQHATTGADGQFVFTRVAHDPQLLTVQKSGFQSFTQRVAPPTQGETTINATLKVAALAESVVVRGTVNPEAKPVPSREDVMVTPETLRVLDRKQIEAAGPVAGGAQMVSFTPGANVVGYGETGATKYTILLNGIEQGWAGEATSFTGAGSLGITYDGVPVVDPATGLWQSATMPQNLIIQDLGVTYGPGQPMNRWYSDVGGRVEYTPVQPTVDRHLSLEGSEGPYGQQNFALVGNTGAFKGWSTVVGGGVGRGDDYRPGPGWFREPGEGRIRVRQDAEDLFRRQPRLRLFLFEGRRLSRSGYPHHRHWPRRAQHRWHPQSQRHPLQRANQRLLQLAALQRLQQIRHQRNVYGLRAATPVHGSENDRAEYNLV